MLIASFSITNILLFNRIGLHYGVKGCIALVGKPIILVSLLIKGDFKIKHKHEEEIYSSLSKAAFPEMAEMFYFQCPIQYPHYQARCKTL